MVKSNAAKKVSPNVNPGHERRGVNPRAALLDAMKAEVSLEPEARESFRADVQQVLEVWDGKLPLVWFTWELGTHLMMLSDEKASRERAHADRREAAVAIDMALGGKCFYVDGESAPLMSLPFSDVQQTVREYYRDRTPLVSVHA